MNFLHRKIHIRTSLASFGLGTKRASKQRKYMLCLMLCSFYFISLAEEEGLLNCIYKTTAVSVTRSGLSSAMPHKCHFHRTAWKLAWFLVWRAVIAVSLLSLTPLSLLSSKRMWVRHCFIKHAVHGILHLAIEVRTVSTVFFQGISSGSIYEYFNFFAFKRQQLTCSFQCC